jgi:hypothetical protein
LAVGGENFVTSGDLGVFIDQAAEPVSPQYPDIRTYCRRRENTWQEFVPFLRFAGKYGL